MGAIIVGPTRARDVPFTPAGTIAADDVQEAIEEVRAEAEPTIPPGTYVDTTTAQTFAGAKRATDRLSFRKSPWADPYYFGAVADGNLHPASERYGSNAAVAAAFPTIPVGEAVTTAQLDWLACQEAVNLLGGLSHDSTLARSATDPLNLLGGAYRLHKALKITSVRGFKLMASGRDVAVLQATAAMDTLLDLDGLISGVVEDVHLKSIAGALVNNLCHLHWSTSPRPALSTSGCSLRRMYLREGDWVNGLSVGIDNSDQVDGCLFEHVIVVGTANDDATRWQKAFQIGDGNFGNNLGHMFLHCQPIRGKIGVKVNPTGFVWLGGQVGSNGTDFDIAPKSSMTIAHFRSENSKKFLTAAGGSTEQTCHVADVLFGSGQVSVADPNWLYASGSGTLILDNVQQYGAPADVVAAGLHARFGSPAGDANPLTVVSRGLSQQNSLHNGSGVLSTGIRNIAGGTLGAGHGVTLDLRAYKELNSSGQAVNTTNEFVWENGEIVRWVDNNGDVFSAKDFEITASTRGFIHKSPDGTRWRVTVGNDGALVSTAL